MTGLVRFCAVAIAAAGFAALTSGTLRAEECKTFGSVGSGLSKSVATLMAKQGAINISEARGLKARPSCFPARTPGSLGPSARLACAVTRGATKRTPRRVRLATQAVPPRPRSTSI